MGACMVSLYPESHLQTQPARPAKPEESGQRGRGWEPTSLPGTAPGLGLHHLHKARAVCDTGREKEYKRIQTGHGDAKTGGRTPDEIARQQVYSKGQQTRKKPRRSMEAGVYVAFHKMEEG